MQITLRDVTKQDRKLLFHLLQERPGYANISHKVIPEWIEHCAFVESVPYPHWYIIEGLSIGGTKDVGSIYLTNKDEIGIAILKKFWRQGYAKSAIKELIRMQPRKRYYANIAPKNVFSQKMFRNMGFEVIQQTMIYDKK